MTDAELMTAELMTAIAAMKRTIRFDGDDEENLETVLAALQRETERANEAERRYQALWDAILVKEEAASMMRKVIQIVSRLMVLAGEPD